ncbi:MAG: MmcB family DNA repair protein [Pseudomonadota bacterium]
MGTKQELGLAVNGGGEALVSRPQVTQAITRGARRMLSAMGQSSLVEVTLKGGRRADILAFDKTGRITIVEVKSGQPDFAADGKWREYLEFCDRFYFAVDQDFPQTLIPDDCGLMVADSYEAAIIREASEVPLAPARRRAMMLTVARVGADRLHLLQDPGLAL